MPTTELLAEIEVLKKQIVGLKMNYSDCSIRLEEWEERASEEAIYASDMEERSIRAERMAALWKRAAKSNFTAYNITVAHFDEALEAEDKAERELAALKKDARVLATWSGNKEEINAAIARILEATKEVEYEK